jgi:hypothetical protein
LRIRSGDGAARAPRSAVKRVAVPQYQIPTATVSVKKRRRAETPDDTIEPFSPDFDPDFDDIDPEPEPEPQEPSVPPLVQARRLRASPTLQVLEHRVEKASDPNKECYQALLELCARVRWHHSHLRARLTCLSQFAKDRGCDMEDILLDEVVQTLSAILPSGS